jgi:uncharacterized coiled-coil protein SlyX
MNDKTKSQKYLLICEQSSSKLNRIEDSDYVFEGVFTEFGIENSNGRIYEEKEYLPHLDYLRKKIEKNMLVGELDHPEKFDVSYSKASHIIEKLEYNKDKRQIVGRIRLLNTTKGKDAKALVDGGVQLSISSRAAGKVDENKKVKLNHIFTYDLVNEPGFPNANLLRVTENFNLPENSNVQIYEFISDKYYEEGNQKALEEIPSMEDSIVEDVATDHEIEKEFITRDKLEAYSKKIAERFHNLETSIAEKDDKIKSLELQLSETAAKQEEHSDYLAEEIKTNLGYITLIAEHADNLIGFSNRIVENQRNLKDFIDISTEKINELVTEHDHQVNYSNFTMNTLSESVLFIEDVAKEVKIISEHNQHLTEGINTIGKYCDYIKNEGLEKTINFIEQVAETVEMTLSKNNAIMEVTEIKEKPVVTEDINLSVEPIKEENTKFINKIDEILEAVKKQKTARITENIGFAYFNLLGAENQNTFLALPDNQKQQVVEEVNKRKPVSETEFVQVWEAVLNPARVDSIIESLIKEIPNEYKKVWELLDESTKNKIVGQSQFYNLSNSAAIKNFWQTRRELNEAVEIQLLEKNMDTQKSINESQQIDPSISLGYGLEHIQMIKFALDKKFSNK